MKTNLLLIICATLIFAGCKTEGCTYPEATNYDADADQDDGSCLFPEPDEEEDPSSSSSTAADAWVGNYLATQTSTLEGTTESTSTTFGVSITEINETTVLIESLLGCDLEANVTPTSLVVVEFVEFCEASTPLILQTENGFTYSGNTFGFETRNVEGVAIRQ